MSQFASWIFAATGAPSEQPVRLSRTATVEQWVDDIYEAVRDYRIDVEDWPTVAGWSCGFTPNCVFGGWDGSPMAVSLLTKFTHDLAEELRRPVAVGWSENGATFGGCLAGAEQVTGTDRDNPLLIGYGLQDMALEMYDSGPTYLTVLQQRWDVEEWQQAAAPAVIEWLHAAGVAADTGDNAEASAEAVHELFDDDYGDAAIGLCNTLELVGFAFPQGDS